MAINYRAEYKREFSPPPINSIFPLIGFQFFFVLLLILNCFGIIQISSNSITQAFWDLIFISIIVGMSFIILFFPAAGYHDEIHTQGFKMQSASIFDFILNKGSLFRFDDILFVELLSFYKDNNYNIMAITLKSWPNKQIFFSKDAYQNDFFSKFVTEVQKRGTNIQRKKYIRLNVFGFRKHSVFLS